MFLQFILRRMWRPLNTFPLNPSQENMIACRSSILELTYFSLDRHCCAFLQGKKKKRGRVEVEVFDDVAKKDGGVERENRRRRRRGGRRAEEQRSGRQGRLMRWGGEVESFDGLGEGDSLKRSRVQISCLQSWADQPAAWHHLHCEGGEAQQKGSRRPGLGSTVDAIVKGLSTLCPQNCKDLVRLFSRTSTETIPPFGKKTMQRWRKRLSGSP